MILRNGIKSTLRSKGRSTLFTLLILMLTVTLALGSGMWAYCDVMLKDMDELYTSIALIEYMGSDYPNVNTTDEYARAAAEELASVNISAIDGVKLWEQNDRALGSIEGYERIFGDVPYGDHAVIECIQFVPMYNTGYRELTEAELPDSYIAINYSDWTLKSESGTSFNWLPFYMQDGDGCYRLELNLDGNPENIYTPSDELPDEYVTWHVFSDNFVYHNSDGTTAVLDSTNRFDYYPEQDIYYGSMEILTGYSAITNQILYAREIDSPKMIVIDLNGHDFVPEDGVRYTIHGKFIFGSTKHDTLAITDFYEGCEAQPYQASNDVNSISPLFSQYADHYNKANNYVNIEASDDIAALEVFQQGSLYLAEGRFPEVGETGVCVISGEIASWAGLSVGDTISLDIFSSAENDRFSMTTSGNVRELEIIGITNLVEAYYGNVWVSGGEGCFNQPLFGYQLGRAVLDNTSARAAADAIEALCPQGVRVTLYDQGYSSAAQPLETMKTTAMAVSIASICGTLAVLLLFAYLFVGRQREPVQILSSLGTPAHKIRLWLLSGAALISGVSALLGAFAGAAALDKIIKAALKAAQELYAVDGRYSESAIGVVKEMSITSEAPMWPAITSGFAVLAVSLIFCLAFLGQARRQSAPRRGKVSVRAPKSGTSTLGRGALRFALLSAKRGGWRSVVVPIAALVLSLFLSILSIISEGWGDQLDALYRNAEISGEAVSINGRQNTGLVVSAQNARLLYKSGLVEDISVSIGWNYWMMEDMPKFGTGGFAEETRDNWISIQPDIIATNSLSAAPEFMNGGAPEVEWLDGWDESFLESTEYTPFVKCMTFRSESHRPTIMLDADEPLGMYPCLVSRDFMENHGLSIGDKFLPNMKFTYTLREETLGFPFMIVGCFTPTGADNNIYVPLSFCLDPEAITGEEDVLEPGQRVSLDFTSREDRDDYFFYMTNFTTCTFTLKSAGDLDLMRDYLENGKISAVGKLSQNRMTIILRDQTFVETVGGLGRYISFGEILFPVLYAVVALLGFIISWLMVNGRRMEFAILRGLGASKIRVFFSFFLEQAVLCTLGLIIGVIGMYLTVNSIPVNAVLLFLSCYLIGCALSVMAVGRTHLMTLLSERE